MQVQVVRHDRGANNANRYEKHSGMVKTGSDQRPPHLEKLWPGLWKHENFDEITTSDSCDQHQNDGFDRSHPKALQGQQ